MPTYPTNIRILDAATFKESSEDVALSLNETDGGYAISRPKFTRRPRRTFSWRYVEMRDADKAALLAFWELVKGRSNAFNWQHPVSGTIYNVRFGDMEMSFSRAGYGPINLWQSDTIVIKEV